MRSEMTQAIADYVASAMADMWVALPGTVVAYDTATGRVNVKPFGSLKKPDGSLMEYPIVTGVPICQPHGIATPVRAGTACLLVMCDIDISGWIAGKSGGAALRHNLSNAVCIPGLQKTSTAEQNLANARGCVCISGGLYVDGPITCTGNCNAPNID